MSIFAHVALQGGAPETAATQGLGHILNSNLEIAQAFVDITGNWSELLKFEPRRIVVEAKVESSGRPDLTVYDKNGRVQLLVENKFWAGLTDAQPVSYLNDLPEDIPATLLFIVPGKRLSPVWKVLKNRCQAGRIKLTKERRSNNVTAARARTRVLAITDWAHVLAALEVAADGAGRTDTKNDVLQLRALANRMDAEAFLPLNAQEITDQILPRRLFDYIGLVTEIANRLASEGTVTLRQGTADYGMGRYLNIGETGLQPWLGIPIDVWRAVGTTPVWWWINRTGIFEDDDCWRKLPVLFEGMHESDGGRFFPIWLKTGADRGVVVDDAVAQIHGVIQTLREMSSAT